MRDLAGPEGFDPTACGSEDRRDILTTLRAPALLIGSPISNKPSFNSEIVINPGVLTIAVLGVLRQVFCNHKGSFAYRRYGEFYFVEFSSCASAARPSSAFRALTRT